MPKKVLLIDDEKEWLEPIALELQKLGYDVALAFDGLNGLEMAKRENPDLIFLDIRMPGLNGFEVLERLKAAMSIIRTPVIMFTVKSETDAIFRAQELGSSDYLVKPFTFEDLLALVQWWVGPPD